jgi:hypothetical protein
MKAPATSGPHGATPAVIRRVEAMAVRGTERHWKLIPDELAARLRPRVERVGDGLLTQLPRSDSLRMNRVIGVGHRGDAQATWIDEIVERYRGARLRRFSFLLSPGPQAEAITSWLAARGFEPHGGYTLLLRDARRPPPRSRPTGLRVARARRSDRETVVRIIEECFGSPRSRRSWTMASVGAPGYEHYLAFVGRTAVAVGTLQVEGDMAWLGGGATSTRWRRRGAHGALIAARLARAARLGCRWVWVQTNLPGRGQRDASRRNLLRLGFEQACLKPSFVWTSR